MVTIQTYAIGIAAVQLRYKLRFNKKIDSTSIRDRSNDRKNHELIRRLGAKQLRLIAQAHPLAGE